MEIDHATGFPRHLTNPSSPLSKINGLDDRFLRNRFPSVRTNLIELGAAVLAHRMNPGNAKVAKRFQQIGIHPGEIRLVDAEISRGEELNFSLEAEGEMVEINVDNDDVMDQLAKIGEIDAWGK